MTLLAAPHAHLLLQADPGRAEDVARWLAGVQGVTSAAVTSGPYDVIVVVDLGEAELPRVLGQVRRAPGLAGLRVCRPALP